MPIAKNVAPRGLPTWRSFWVGELPLGELGGLWEEKFVLRRKSCVTAIPIEAKEREVRSQARKVRSVRARSRQL